MTPADSTGRPGPPLLRPTAYSTAAGAAAAPAAGHGGARLLAAALVLALFALAVASVLVLPRYVAPDGTAETPVAAPASATGAPPPAAALPEEPPDPILSPEEQAAERKRAQDDLAALLARMDALRGRAVERWAGDPFAAVESRLAEGELAYREQRYPAARNAYRAAIAAVDTIEQAIPVEIARHLEAGGRALAQGESGPAHDAFAAALAIDPAHTAARAGLARAESLDRVLALLNEGRGYERLGDAAQARQAFAEALALDAEATEAREAIARLDGAARQAAFEAAMSAGFAALEDERYEAAERAFGQALAHQPGARSAERALAQTTSRATAARIARALAAAEEAERAERWTDAVARYHAALEVDAALDAARRGVTRAGHRAGVDAVLERLLAKPARLADPAVQDEAMAALRQARAIERPGPRLRQQIERLDRAALEARTPVAVTVRSDGVTEVEVPRAALRGRFEVEQVGLVPGRYTATGRRVGYRDVRVEFTVAPGQPPPVIAVVCTEAVEFH